VDQRAVLAAFDEQVRRNPVPGPGGWVERDAGVIRVVDPGGWSGVAWSGLDAGSADRAIGRQLARFAGLAGWEWKHYGYDRPADLPRRLAAAGLVPGPPEAVLVADRLGTEPSVPPGVQLVPVTDRAGVDLLVRVHREAFGHAHPALETALLARLIREPGSVAAVVVLAGDRPVCAGRVEFHRGTEFASLWGGGTVPDWRGRGLFRALVTYRAALAAARGFRYLQVDALPASEPILVRLGFTRLTTTTPYTLPDPT
jgi:hypothetical protein